MAKSKNAKRICVEFYPEDYKWLEYLKQKSAEERERDHKQGYGLSPYVRKLVISDLKKQKRREDKEKQKAIALE